MMNDDDEEEAADPLSMSWYVVCANMSKLWGTEPNVGVPVMRLSDANLCARA